MNHFERKFKFSENQELWDRYFAAKVEEINNNGKQTKTKPELIVAQYKTMLLVLEESSGKLFKDILPLDIQKVADTASKGAHVSHINAFFVTVISMGWIQASVELIISTLPEEYRGLARALLNNNSK